MWHASTCLAVILQAAPLLALDIDLHVVDDACGNGVGSITAYISNGAPPYTVLWSNGAPTVTDSAMASISGLFAGAYSLTVTDLLGTVTTVDTEVMNSPGLDLPWTSAEPFPACDGACIHLTYTLPWAGVGAGPPYSLTADPPVSVSFGSGGPYMTISELCPGNTYELTFSDALGCPFTWELSIEDLSSPELLSQSITGSCPANENGTAELVFDQPVIFYMLPNGSSTPVVTFPAPDQVHISGLGPGVYDAYVYPEVGPTCFDSLQFVVPLPPEGCGLLSGHLYADLDGDCSYGPDDSGMPHRVVVVEPGPINLMTDGQGAFSGTLALGNYVLSYDEGGYVALCPDPIPSAFELSEGDPTAQLDLYMDPLLGPDAGVVLSVSGHLLGNPATYWVTVTNHGPYPMNDLELTLAYDPVLSFATAFPTLTSNTPGLAQWSIASLEPFATLTCSLNVAVPDDEALLDTEVAATATLVTGTPDSNANNDVHSVDGIVIGPYDPNDKRAFTPSAPYGEYYYLGSGEPIDYLIRFQNTGSAPAQNVHIIDTLTTVLNMGSFTMLGASHHCEVSLLEERILRFDLPGIMLPDSASDPAGSNGFVRFRITPSDPAEGTAIVNSADIFFDGNSPIKTNDATLMVQLMPGMEETPFSAASIRPNPVRDVLRVSGLPRTSMRFDVHGMDGRLITRTHGYGPDHAIDVGPMPSGAYLLRSTTNEGASFLVTFVKE